MFANPPPPLHNKSAGRSKYLRYITNNALQISQYGGYLILCIYFKDTSTFYNILKDQFVDYSVTANVIFHSLLGKM